jgi:hypothetical protein
MPSTPDDRRRQMASHARGLSRQTFDETRRHGSTRRWLSKRWEASMKIDPVLLIPLHALQPVSKVDDTTGR